MNDPDWRAFALEKGVLLEPNADRQRLVVWRPVDRDDRFQYWERIANVSRADVKMESGLWTSVATLIRARQWVGGLVGRIWYRLREPKGKRDFLLPGGASAEQCGVRQNDLMLVWCEHDAGSIDEARLKSLWPKANGFLKLAENLFVVLGLESRADGRHPVPAESPMLAAESPRAQAEAILAAARQTGAPDREATALTDLGVIALNQGDAKVAIESLERALAIATELGDQAREGDVVGNLGMAMLAVRQPERAQALFERQLAFARSASDRFAEKVAMERLGIASWNRRDFSGALELFDRALALARELGDRQQEASLLWHQGIQHAELGQREEAIARAEQSVALYSALGKPQAASHGAYLQKYRMGLADDPQAALAMGLGVEESPQHYLGGSIVASVMAGSPSAQSHSPGTTRGPGLLRMALSATKAMAGFAGSGFETAPAETQRRRLQTCSTCEHHTGLRCQVCGCFTGVKSRMLHEECPIGKWPM